MSGFSTIRVATDAQGIATVTLDRPQKHHAMNATMMAELTGAAMTLGKDPAVRAVILAAEGPTFCAGGDLDWMREQQEADAAGKAQAAQGLFAMLSTLDEMPKPLIGRIQGNAWGGGLGLISVCDLAIAAEGVRFALTETRLGLIPATIGPFVLRKTGPGMGRQIFFTGATFGTDFALRSGLLYQACPAADLDQHIAEITTAVLRTTPGAVAMAKEFCRDPAVPGPDGAALSVAALARCWEGEEAQSRITAFLSRSETR